MRFYTVVVPVWLSAIEPLVLVAACLGPRVVIRSPNLYPTKRKHAPRAQRLYIHVFAMYCSCVRAHTHTKPRRSSRRSGRFFCRSRLLLSLGLLLHQIGGKRGAHGGLVGGVGARPVGEVGVEKKGGGGGGVVEVVE